MALKLDVLIQKDEEDGGFVAIVPALPGCVSQGETMDELLENIKEAIGLWLEASQQEPREHFKVDERIELPLAFA